MQIIPVIDLLDGCVVHAKKGQRDRYKPIKTPLCKGSSPHAVIDGLLSLHSFKTVYVADLNALMGVGEHYALLERLQGDYPTLEFWLDQGVPNANPVGLGLNVVPVIGSESMVGEHSGCLPKLEREFILSLDFIGESLLGDKSLLDNTSDFPNTIIIMSLSRVGTNEGPDFQRVNKFMAQWPERNIIAAGGVRNADDLNQLDGLGVGGVLIASALHSGALEPSVLLNYC